MLLQMGPLGPVMTLVPSIAQNMFMPKNINSFYCYYHIGGHWENKNVHQKNDNKTVWIKSRKHLRVEWLLFLPETA